MYPIWVIVFTNLLSLVLGFVLGVYKPELKPKEKAPTHKEKVGQGS